jgi:hypothetical protein
LLLVFGFDFRNADLKITSDFEYVFKTSSAPEMVSSGNFADERLRRPAT